jgi:hypothetical protein
MQLPLLEKSRPSTTFCLRKGYFVQVLLFSSNLCPVMMGKKLCKLCICMSSAREIKVFPDL